MGYRFIGVLETGNGPADIPAGPAPGGEAEPLPASPAPDLAQVHDPEHERQPAQALEHAPAAAAYDAAPAKHAPGAPGDHPRADAVPPPVGPTRPGNTAAVGKEEGVE